MKPETNKPASGGLTLAEAMVMLVVVAMLATVLFWWIPSRNEWALRASCMSNLKQIGLSCRLYSADFRGEFPYVENAKDSNENFYLLLPNHMTTTSILVCPTDIATPKPLACRNLNYGGFANFLKAKNVNSYSYVAGLNEKSSADSPLAGDMIMNPLKANDTTVTQYQKRRTCADLGSNHGKAGGNVVFVDGHAVWNSGPKLKIRWVDGAGGTINIKNPK